MLAIPPDQIAPRPTLHLSGPKLRTALASLIQAAETVGGLERFVVALQFKSDAFRERLDNGKAARLDRGSFDEILPLMPTARRRAPSLIERIGWESMRHALAVLLEGAHVTSGAASRLDDFGRRLAPGAEHRFVRDLAAEILHNVLPEHYPLMTRWMWDTKTNTGVLREIWHDPIAGDDTDHVVIDVPDDHETFLVLREELSQFLSSEGIFRDMLWYVDVLAAHVYANYINAQGGAWLKTDFGSESDPIEHTRRLLGLDYRGAGLQRRSRRHDVATNPGGARQLPPNR